MNLKGRKILLYIDGGWTISGMVEKFDKDKIIISVKNKEDLYLIFRNKISIVKLIEDAYEDEFSEPKQMDGEAKETNFPENKLSYSENNFFLPRDLIKKELKDSLSDNDFSIMFSDNSGGKLNIRSKNDKED